jgi:Fibronectin type III domain
MPEIKYVSQEYVSYYPQIADIVDPPQAAPVATISGSNSVSVAFTPAVTGGAATSYKVTTYLAPNYRATSFIGTGTSSPITVTGLNTDATYRFKVQGINASGGGPLSYASNAVGFGSNTGDHDDNDIDGVDHYWDERD